LALSLPCLVFDAADILCRRAAVNVASSRRYAVTTTGASKFLAKIVKTIKKAA
jgi:hypothetical protein